MTDKHKSRNIRECTSLAPAAFITQSICAICEHHTTDIYQKQVGDLFPALPRPNIHSREKCR
eukprot:m.206867 g.206867  ORF g.206867 m.206867 type:complete len:62 (+) comp39684_c0_seq1:104-289(+)